MNFQEAVTTVLTKRYADFSGRSRRSEYWFFALAAFIAGIVVGIIDAIIGTQILGWILNLALLVPGLAVSARRLHDVGRSGWWILIGLTGIGLFVLLYWYVQDSEPGTNAYGPSPKQGEALPPSGQWGQQGV